MNKLTIKNKKGLELTASTWREGFIAVDEERHWEEGRSAERLANDFSNGSPSTGELSLRGILKLFLGVEDREIVWTKACIEHGSRFDKYRRPRMQDLAIWGEAGGKTFFVGVEAKVDEPFGSKSIGEQEEYIKGLKKRTNAGKRLSELTDDFLNGIDDAVYKVFRYQLLYYLAGSFRENADIILMPVFSYHSDKYDERKGGENYSAYKYFMEKLGFTEVNGEVDNMLVAYAKEICAFDRERQTLLKKRVYSCYFLK